MYIIDLDSEILGSCQMSRYITFNIHKIMCMLRKSCVYHCVDLKGCCAMIKMVVSTLALLVRILSLVLCACPNKVG